MKKVHVSYIGVTEGKNETLKKEVKMWFSIFFFIYTIHVAYLKVYTNFIILNQEVAVKTDKKYSICVI